MKFLAVFVAVVAAASALTPTTVWTQQELEHALINPHTDHLLVPFLADAYDEMVTAAAAGNPMETIVVTMPYIASYTLNELSDAIQNPATNPAHLPYLEAALNEMMTNIMSGQDQMFVTVAIPGELMTPDTIEVGPSPVQVPVEVPVQVPVEAPVQVPVEAPVQVPVEAPVQVPVEAPVQVPVQAPVSSPLVQIIVNVNNQQQVTEVATPAAPAEESEIIPTPVGVVEEAFVPELIIPGPEISPPFNPVDVIAVLPVNPAPAVVGPLRR